MNILVFCQAAWSDTNAVGNTVSNFFCEDVWKDDSFSNFYVRKQIPNNKSNVRYYNLSASDIVKGILKLKIQGRSFSSNTIHSVTEEYKFAHEKEQYRIDNLHRNMNEFIYFGHEQIWRSKVWVNHYFEEFVFDKVPDVFFAFASSPYILWPLIKYLKKHTKCKIVLFVADDVYGSYENSAWYRKGYLKREFEKCIMAADKLYGASTVLCEEYGKKFGVSFHPLYKGCQFDALTEKINTPIRIVYAGNLYYGRDDVLSVLGKTLKQLNANGQRATLEIYTGATITQELKDKLNIPGSSEIMGVRPYEEIREICHKADVVVHVESFEQAQIDCVHYSFSTKIIDCLQSGNISLAIGPAGIASIEYMRQIPGVHIVDDLCNLKMELEAILSNPKQLLEDASKTRKFAIEHHEINTMRSKLRKELEELLET